VILLPELCLRLFAAAIGLWCLHVQVEKRALSQIYATKSESDHAKTWP